MTQTKQPPEDPGGFKQPNVTLIAFVIGLAIVYVASKLAIASVWLYVNELKDMFRLSESAVSAWSGIARSTVACLLAVLIAYIGDRLSRSRVLYVSIGMLVSWLVTAPLVDNPSLLMISFFLFVSFSAAILPLAFALFYTRNKGGGLATMIGLIVSGELLSVLIGMQASDFVDWVNLLGLLGVVSLVGGLVMAFSGIDRSLPESIAGPSSSHSGSIWLLILATMLTFSAVYASVTWEGVLIVRSTSETASEVGRWTLIPIVSMFLGRIAGGVFSDWRVKRTQAGDLLSALIGTCGMTLALIGLVWATTLAPIVIVGAVVAFGGGLVYAPIVAQVLRLSNQRLLATSVALVFLAINLGLLFGPSFAGLVSDYFYQNGESLAGESLRKALAWFSVPTGLAMCMLAIASRRGLSISPRQRDTPP